MNTEIKDALGQPITLGAFIMYGSYNGGQLNGPYRVEAIKSVIKRDHKWVAYPGPLVPGQPSGHYVPEDVPETKIAILATSRRQRNRKQWLRRFKAVIVVNPPTPSSAATP